MGGHRLFPKALTKIINMITAASHAIGLASPPLRNLSMGMIRAQTSKAPKLKAKAAESRKLVPVVLYILERFMPLETPHAQTRPSLQAWGDVGGMGILQPRLHDKRGRLTQNT